MNVYTTVVKVNELSRKCWDILSLTFNTFWLRTAKIVTVHAVEGERKKILIELFSFLFFKC
jgi:hypothetical protein